MNPTQLDPTYSEALRTKLVEQVNAITATHPRRRRRLWFGTGVFVGTCVLGGAVAVATGLLPLPGGQAVTQLGAPITQTQTGTGTVELGSVPSGATNVSVKLTCLSAGTFVFPDGASMTCSTSDAGTPSSFTTYSLSLSPVEHAITIRTAAGNRWQLTAEYVNQVTTTWKVNANGQTYGVENSHGVPDLIAAVASNGRQGYIKKNELDAANGSNVTSQAEALKWQQAHAGATTDIPVYDSDGTSVIGQFVMEGG
jgi:hypothetical protein